MNSAPPPPGYKNIHCFKCDDLTKHKISRDRKISNKKFYICLECGFVHSDK
jgi:predicted RNA-binding Zn-ribbon protein involved in translation (DUF1610 family)